MACHQVKLYSTPTCSFCQLAKKYFKDNEIAFVELDVSENQKNAEQMVSMSGQTSTPVVKIDENVIVGFQPQVFDALLLDD